MFDWKCCTFFELRTKICYVVLDSGINFSYVKQNLQFGSRLIFFT